MKFNSLPAGPIREVTSLFLRMGLTAFGGPAAHIAMFRDEVVTRRKWLSDDEFLDLLAATNLIPGPNSTEMAIHLGYLRAGWRGLIAGGIAFIFPAFVIVLAIAAIYKEYGTTPTAQWLLYGVQPVVIAIILQAVWGLGRSALKDWLVILVAALAFGLYFLSVHELLLLFAGGFVVLLFRHWRKLGIWFHRDGKGLSGLLIWLPETIFRPAVNLIATFVQTPAPVTLATLFLTFLKIGAVLYGSGYVLVAFLQTEFVEKLGWITSTQLLDAVAIGQFTPGPVFTTATFIGYQVAGIAGAVVATVGIFLPGFVFVALTNPYIPRLRKSIWLGAFLDGIVAASLGLMAAVTVDLAQKSIVDIPTALIAIIAALLLIRYKLNSTWLILGGAAAGMAVSLWM